MLTVNGITVYAGSSGLLDSEGNAISAQYPLQVDGDSVYAKDIDLSHSDSGTFTGTIDTLVSSYHTEITDTSATNPKTFTVHFYRPVTTTQIGIGSLTGDFSNVKISLQDEKGTDRYVIDESADATKYPANIYSIPPTTFIQAVFEFYTADSVKINGIFIPKENDVIALLKALKPDGTVTYIDATTGGNLKVSVEEGDNEAAPVFVKQQSIEGYSASLEAEAIAASTDYILIDLSDTTNFKHTNTGSILLSFMKLSLNPATTFRGDIEVGFLANVDGTNGDFHEIASWHMDQLSSRVEQFFNAFPGVVTDATHLGPKYLNQAAFNTGSALASPAGTSVSGNGDLALRITRTAGTIDIGVTVGYNTEA